MQDHTTRRPRTTTPPDIRFWKHITPGAFTDCWEWQGALRNGYGVMNIGGKVVYTHRFSYELHYGPLAEGQCALHRCDNRKCCNPYHIFAGTKGDNSRDMYAKGRGNIQAKSVPRVARLTAEQVCQIRQLATQGVKYPALSEQFGVSIPMICLIVTRKRWKHLLSD